MRHPFLLASLLAAAVACTDDPGTSDHPHPGLELYPVVHADGRFVAAGTRHLGDGTSVGHVATSSDGDAWTAVELPGVDAVTAVAFGGGRWVIAAHAVLGPSQLMVTDDLATVRPATDGPGLKITGLAYGNGVFVAAPENDARMFVSSDGDTWTAVDLAQLWSWSGAELAFLDGRFYAYGYGSMIAESTDGRTWTVFDVGATRVETLQLHGGRVIGTAFRGEAPAPVQQLTLDGPGPWTAVPRAGAPLWDFSIVDGALVGVNGDDVVRDPVFDDDWALEPVLHTRPWGIAADVASVVAVGSGIDVSPDGGVTWSRVWE